MGLPLTFHILANASTFADAVEANIRAGGDSAGRAIMIGAVMGAAHGIGGDAGIPADYLVKMHNAASLWQYCQQLVALCERCA
jgi:ADP-ribosylglycohydrolase